jgi:hypothetical protein
LRGERSPYSLDDEAEKVRANGDEDVDVKDGALDLPITVIPAQTQTALSFTSPSEGPLAIRPDPSDPTPDNEQLELYALMRAQLRELLNEVPSQERNRVTELI